MIAHHPCPGVGRGCIKKPRLAPRDPVSTLLGLLWIAVPQHRFNFRNVIGIKDRQSAIAQSGGVLTGLEQELNIGGGLNMTGGPLAWIHQVKAILSRHYYVTQR